MFRYDGTPLPPGISDTKFISDKLESCTTEKDILNTLSKIQGPWAFVLWDKVRSCLWYGRDFFGRQSLLIHKSEERLILTSCATKSEGFPFKEVAANGIYKLDLKLPLSLPTLFPWDVIESLEDDSVRLSTETIQCPVRLICDKRPELATRNSMPESNAFDTVICDKEPKLLDSTVNNQSVSCDDEQTDETLIFPELLDQPSVMVKVEELISRLTEAVRLRMETQPGRCKLCIKVQIHIWALGSQIVSKFYNF